MYPNPIQDKLFINKQVDETSTSDSEYKVIIFNQSSMVVYQETTSKGLNLLLLDQLPPGIYFVEILYNNTKKAVEKIIKR